MNKRQAKKAFKKKYRCTPNQAIYVLEKLQRLDWDKVAENISEGIGEFAEALKTAIEIASKQFAEVAKAIHEGGWQ